MLQGMAVLNTPWKGWSSSMQKAVLALTFVNVVLAAAAYFVLLRRWL